MCQRRNQEDKCSLNGGFERVSWLSGYLEVALMYTNRNGRMCNKMHSTLSTLLIDCAHASGSYGIRVKTCHKGK